MGAAGRPRWRKNRIHGTSNRALGRSHRPPAQPGVWAQCSWPACFSPAARTCRGPSRNTQFWPFGEAPTPEQPAPPETAATEPEPTPVQAPAAEPDERVVRVQTRLVELGYDPGPVDGLIGPKTRAAIRSFQANRGVAVDGEVSRTLLARLAEPPDPDAGLGTLAPAAAGGLPTPSYAAGSRYVYASGEVWTVEEVDGAEVSWHSNRRGRLTAFDNFLLPALRWSAPTGQGSREYESATQGLWPSDAGDAVSFAASATAGRGSPLGGRQRAARALALPPQRRRCAHVGSRTLRDPQAPLRRRSRAGRADLGADLALRAADPPFRALRGARRGTTDRGPRGAAGDLAEHGGLAAGRPGRPQLGLRPRPRDRRARRDHRLVELRLRHRGRHHCRSAPEGRGTSRPAAAIARSGAATAKRASTRDWPAARPKVAGWYPASPPTSRSPPNPTNRSSSVPLPDSETGVLFLNNVS